MPHRIVVFTSSHLCRNPRVLKEATSLGAAGFDVTVLTASADAKFERMDRALAAGLPFRFVAVDFVARARIANLLQKSATWWARRILRWFRIESAQALGPAGPLLRRALQLPADLLIAHTEIPMWAARVLIAKGRSVAVDFEDWYSRDLLYSDRRSRPIGLLGSAEEFALRHAKYTSTTSQALARAMAEANNAPEPLVVRNVFPLQSASRLDLPATSGLPSLVWFSQTIGPGRGLELFFAAWSRTKSASRVILIGSERAEFRARLLRRLSPERRALVTFIPFVPPESLPNRLAEFDIGLALEARSPESRDLTITNKIFQYMNAGLAVIATDTAGQAEVFRAAPEIGLMVQAHETALFAGQIDRLLESPELLRGMQAASRRAAEMTFCWEREAPRMIGAVRLALGGPAARGPLEGPY